MVFQGIVRAGLMLTSPLYKGPDKRPWAIKRMANTSASEKLANLREANFLKDCHHKNICAYKATYECLAQHEMWLIMVRHSVFFPLRLWSTGAT